MNIEFNDFGLEWDHGDGIKHKADYDDLAEVYEKYGERQWIPVSERMPEERDSIFKAFKGTDKWTSGMFEKISSTVIATVRDKNGRIKVIQTHTVDGRWKFDGFSKQEVLAWMPEVLPEPWKGE